MRNVARHVVERPREILLGRRERIRRLRITRLRSAETLLRLAVSGLLRRRLTELSAAPARVGKIRPIPIPWITVGQTKFEMLIVRSRVESCPRTEVSNWPGIAAVFCKM